MNWRKFSISYLLFFISTRCHNLKHKTGLVCLAFNTVIASNNYKISKIEKKESYTKPDPFVFDSYFEVARAVDILVLFSILYGILFLLMIIINWLFIGCSFIFLTVTGVLIYVFSGFFIIFTNPILLT